MKQSSPDPKTIPAWGRAVYTAVGFLFVGLGLVGAFLPVLPTTPFLIVAAACFARSSRRLEAWLLEHPRFGSVLREWRLRGAVPRKAKLASLVGTIVGYALFWITTSPGPLLAVAVAASRTTRRSAPHSIRHAAIPAPKIPNA